MPAQILRPYQADGLRRIAEAYRRGAQRVLAVAPTGSGKTTVFSTFIDRLKSPALVLVHRRELATQAAERLQGYGVDFGFIMAGETPRPWAKTQIASIQSLAQRVARGLAVPPARVVVPDEAHLSTAETYQKILAWYPQAMLLGVTATPWRLSGKPLASLYDETVVIAEPHQLREQGHLCDYVGFSYKTPDLSAVSTTAGDYNDAESAAAMRQPSIVTNIVEQWQAHASDLSTIVFAVTVEHSKELCEQFKAAGVRAEHLDGKTALDTRRAILRRVENGETRVLCNVGVAVEGLDIPRVKCIVLARPTKSLSRYLQMVGRGRRPWDNQVCRIHDHAFLIRLHGLPDALRDYNLDAKPEAPPPVRTCEVCFAAFEGTKCPSCQHENAIKPRERLDMATVDDAEQFEFNSSGNVPAPAPGMVDPGHKPVTRIEWRAKVNKPITGVFAERLNEDSKLGGRKLYRISTPSRDYILPGKAMLDRKMLLVNIGDKVRVTYEGEFPIGPPPADVTTMPKYAGRFSVKVDR